MNGLEQKARQIACYCPKYCIIFQGISSNTNADIGQNQQQITLFKQSPEGRDMAVPSK